MRSLVSDIQNYALPDARSQIPDPGWRLTVIGQLVSGIWNQISGIRGKLTADKRYAQAYA